MTLTSVPTRSESTKKKQTRPTTHSASFSTSPGGRSRRFETLDPHWTPRQIEVALKLRIIQANDETNREPTSYLMIVYPIENIRHVGSYPILLPYTFISTLRSVTSYLQDETNAIIKRKQPLHLSLIIQWDTKLIDNPIISLRQSNSTMSRSICF